MDGWSCLAVTVAFVGGFGLGIRVILHHHRAAIAELRGHVVASGVDVARAARICRPILVSLGYHDEADRLDATARNLLDCEER